MTETQLPGDIETPVWPASKYAEPKPVTNGIRTPVGFRIDLLENWWSKKWVNVIEDLDIGVRLARGRYYAALGQVVSIDVQPGLVRGVVQGSSQAPYDVSIYLKMMLLSRHPELMAELTSNVKYQVDLLARKLPEEMEALLAGVSTSLFPTSAADLQTKCTCPDWSNPCKHIAAVYIILAAEIDRDPLLLLKLRGVEVSDLCRGIPAERIQLNSNQPADCLRTDDAQRSSPDEQVVDAEITSVSVIDLATTPDDAHPAPVSTEPLPAGFWSSGIPPREVWTDFRAPEPNAALVNSLGRFPFWQGTMNFMETLQRAYHVGSQISLSDLTSTSIPDSTGETEYSA